MLLLMKYVHLMMTLTQKALTLFCDILQNSKEMPSKISKISLLEVL